MKRAVVILMVVGVLAGGGRAADSYENSLGMKMIRIEPGQFLMGQLGDEKQCDWDEQPVHKVTISKAFYISQTEVTIEQYRRFRPDAVVNERYSPYVSGISWHDAQAFCRWLSKKEGKPYRLPTEAEWEYACRAGTKTAFWSGDAPPKAGSANPWGLKNMHTGVREWCNDWYAEYPLGEQVDPIGPEDGLTKVVRGGGMDSDDGRYARSANRASMAPGFAPYPKPKETIERQAVSQAEKSDSDKEPFGTHPIGFRVVQAAMPAGRPLVYEGPFARQGVRQNVEPARIGPDPKKPYFRKRYLLPTPPENCSRQEIDAAGLHPSFRRHNHSPALEVCPNGDVLLVIYTSYREYEPGVSLIAARLRFGGQQWDMPSPMFDFADLNDHAPLLWRDGDRLYIFWGNPRFRQGRAFPFNWTWSDDNGATWSEISFPNFKGQVGCHSKQPINSALRDLSGTLYVSSDGCGGRSLLWATKDNGKTWYDTGGRTGGRHTSFVLLGDGGILGMGGKNTDIDGYMPKSISHDGGRTWVVSKTPFAAQGSNQRPTVLRLQSGRLLFAGDFQNPAGKSPADITQRGSYVALSDDDGKTWHVKKLIGTQKHENEKRLGGADTLGYAVARQAPNGIIHLITTMNRPCLHFAFNEAWILSDDTPFDSMSDAELMQPTATKVTNVRPYQENYPSGKVKIRYHGGVADNGRFLLDGTETWYYENGHKQYEATYRLGRKVGKETYWRPDGTRKWQWEHREDGTSVWTQWWSNGRMKARSTWRNFKCEGTAERWNPSGELISRTRFVDGRAVKQ